MLTFNVTVCSKSTKFSNLHSVFDTEVTLQGPASVAVTCVIVISFFLFLGLDLLRLALLNDSGSKHFISDVDSGKAFLGELLAFAMYVCESSSALVVQHDT